MHGNGHECGACGMLQGYVFMRERDGYEKAQEFALQAAKTYRKALLKVKGMVLRREYIKAYIVAKRALSGKYEE
jgi:hypothetical protein